MWLSFFLARLWASWEKALCSLIVIFLKSSTKLNPGTHPNIYLLKESQHFLFFCVLNLLNFQSILLTQFCSYAFVYYAYGYIWYIICIMYIISWAIQGSKILVLKTSKWGQESGIYPSYPQQAILQDNQIVDEDISLHKMIDLQHHHFAATRELMDPRNGC